MAPRGPPGGAPALWRGPGQGGGPPVGGEVVASLGAPGDVAPLGVHALEVVRVAGTQVLRCSRCSRISLAATRWGALAYSTCRPVGSEPPQPPLVWEREFHQLVDTGLRVVSCARCGCTTATSRATQLRTRMCVARRLTFAGTPASQDWGVSIARTLGWLRGADPHAPRPSCLPSWAGGQLRLPPPFWVAMRR